MDKEMLDTFVYFVNERENVRIRRAAGNLPPWTMDQILRDHHFCNIRREDDRGTKAIRKVVTDWDVEEIADLPWVYTAARLFNHPITLYTYLMHGVEAVKKRRDQGSKTFNTAYVVSTCGKRMDKVDYVHRVVAEVANIQSLQMHNTSCRKVFNALRTVDGLGSFLAGQVVADLKNDRYLADAEDWHTFSVMGPGSKKGLDHIFEGGTNERNYEDRISTLDTLTRGTIPKLHRQDLQNCCCEFSKYMRYDLELPGRRRMFHANT